MFELSLELNLLSSKFIERKFDFWAAPRVLEQFIMLIIVELASVHTPSYGISLIRVSHELFQHCSFVKASL